MSEQIKGKGTRVGGATTFATDAVLTAIQESGLVEIDLKTRQALNDVVDQVLVERLSRAWKEGREARPPDLNPYLHVLDQIQFPTPVDEILGIDPNAPETALADALVRADVDLLDRLRAERRRRGISPAQVAAEMGIKVKHVHAIEGAVDDLNLSTLRRYLFALGVYLEYVIRDGGLGQTPSSD